MKKIFIFIFIGFIATAAAQPQFSKIATMPGAFSRMGFGARGIGMGNAMSAVIDGNLVSYYNPALSAFQKGNSFQTSYSFLSLDRKLNFLNFTRKFDFYSKKDSANENRKPRSSAGVSIGIINSGVDHIDGRDNQGMQTGELSTSENQFFIGLSNRFSEKFSLGIAVKFYYYKLYENITSSGFGLDLGALYRITDQWNVSLTFSDLNSKYKWDTSPVYQEDGMTTIDKFPTIKKIGVSYTNRAKGLIASVELESSNGGTNYIRAGAEYKVIDKLYLRAGIDQINLSNTDTPAKPAAGFSYSRSFGTIQFGVDYAFMLEPYSSQDRHIVGVSVNF